MSLTLFLISVSGEHAAVLCGVKALFSALERVAASVTDHAVSYRPPLLVTDMPGRKAAGQPESRPKDAAAGQTHICDARVETNHHAAR